MILDKITSSSELKKMASDELGLLASDRWKGGRMGGAGQVVEESLHAGRRVGGRAEEGRGHRRMDYLSCTTAALDSSTSAKQGRLVALLALQRPRPSVI